MTVFVASLFLPYTVNFDGPPSWTGPASRSPKLHRAEPGIPEAISPPVSQKPSLDNQSAISLFATTPKPVGALTQSPGSLIQTPGATTDHEKIFRPHIERPIALSLPSHIKEKNNDIQVDQQDLQQQRPVQLKDLRGISRHDLHSPGWGKSFVWNQPPSRAKSPPPSSILKHAAIELKEKAAAVALGAQKQLGRKGHRRSRTGGSEVQFSEYNYTIEKAVIGNGGLFNAIDAAADADLLDEKLWVGTVGCPIDVLEDHMRENIAEKLENDHESLAVYVSDSDLNGHYEHYCKTILWPVFHYQIPDHPKSKAYEDHSWVFYVKVNEAFADRIAKNWKKGDIIWIHDYHLLLVPGLLRQKLPDAEIGFFLHTAFPSSEIFRCLAVRRELLEGILGADMIGFQNDEYGHHFLQTCSRLLNVEATKLGVILENGRFVHVSTCPIGIDPKAIDQQRRVPEVLDWVNTITDKYRGKRIIVGRDKLDNIRGVRQKILSYELFLNKYPEYRDQVVLIQIATSSTEDPELSATVADIVTRVNSTHSTLAHQPLVFLKQDIDFAQYLALLTVAECLMITSLREGMNLTSHEFVMCQDGQFAEAKHGPLILSEFTGSATVFGHNAILVNPWHYTQCADAIKQALDMGSEERSRRWKAMYDYVVNQNANVWYEQYTKALNNAWKEHSVREATSVPRLSVSAVKTKYQKAPRRLIILDYEGTLASWGSPTDIILTTPKRSVDVLNDLTEDKKNIVYVMSSRMPEELERLFSPVTGLGMIAENGAYVKAPDTDEWEELANSDHAKEWKKGVRSILQYYVDRIEGSRIEERHSALVFDYAEAEDLAGAFKQAGECANHINDACQGQGVGAVPIEEGLYISEIGINKGLAAQMISDTLEKSSHAMPDFLMVVGDSREDEYVFNWAHKLEKAGKIRDVVTITLGGRNTEASATLTQGVTGVLSILEKLVRISQS
ncbi:alpha,alpha-trehalose-phosphate synthase [Exophiala viscosa]|uniref:alpha,alpha-trehalose-phosphate synthase n=1 Tax=Exophiala viscosa TaxID=2486360 RepID=UPI00218F5449|nr:alpha,alpha-trehalose-phosphate synthase [Exophiala viscosa]